MCFPNIIGLSLPYIVSEKYNLEYYPIERQSHFKKALKNANKVFKGTCEILQNNKWSGLFVENVGELLLLAATHMRDYEEAAQMFDVTLTEERLYYYYPKRIFTAILEYFEVSAFILRAGLDINDILRCCLAAISVLPSNISLYYHSVDGVKL